MSPRALGLTLAIGVLAASLYGLPAAWLAKRIGRRLVLAGVGLLMAITGADLGWATQQELLVLAGATGMLGAAGVDLGPFLAVEQAMLTESVPAETCPVIAQSPLVPTRSVVVMVAIVPVRILMEMVMVVIVVFFIVWRADHGMLVLGGPRVHVDVEPGGGHFVAHRVFDAHRQGVGILERRLRIGGDMHDGDQLAPYPANPHIVNFENAWD